jgi:hypothetical protein
MCRLDFKLSGHSLFLPKETFCSFQTLVVLHLKILEGILTDDDSADFVRVVTAKIDEGVSNLALA